MAFSDYTGKKINGQKFEYFVENEIGRGQFGIVYRATIANSGQLVAVKVQSRRVIDGNKMYKMLLEREVANLRDIRSPNVIQLIDFFTLDNQQGGDYISILEYCADGDLKAEIDKRPDKCLPPAQAIEYLKQLANGLSALHEKKIAHRDLKLQNILLHNEMIKICDLGFSKNVGEGGISGTALGTPITMAPEILRREAAYNAYQADMYSLGVLFFYMLYGKFPYVAGTNMGLLRKIERQELSVSLISKEIDPTITGLLTAMLSFDPGARLTFKQLYDSPIFPKEAEQGGMVAGKFQMSQLHGVEVDASHNRNIDVYNAPPNSAVAAQGDELNQQFQNMNAVQPIVQPQSGLSAQNQVQPPASVNNQPYGYPSLSSSGSQSQYQAPQQNSSPPQPQYNQYPPPPQPQQNQYVPPPQPQYNQYAPPPQTQQNGFAPPPQQQQQQQQQQQNPYAPPPSSHQQQQQQQQPQNQVNPQYVPPPPAYDIANGAQGTVQSVNEEEHETIRANSRARQARDKAILETLRQYQNEANILDEIANTVLKESKLPTYHSNAIVGMFMMMKRLVVWYQQLLRDIENRRNVFNCQYPQELFNSVVLKNLVHQIRNRMESYTVCFSAYLYELQDMQNKTPEPDIVNQLNENLSPDFMRVYRNALMDFVTSLRGETEKCLRTQNGLQNAIKFQEFTLSVLDCVVMDEVFRQAPIFNFAEYEDKCKKLSFDQREELITQRIVLAYASRQE